MSVTPADYNYGQLPRVITEYSVRNSLDQPLIEGCNYHLTFQSDKAMRFILYKIQGNRCEMRTRQSGKRFTCSRDTLIFIGTTWNKEKAKRIIKERQR